MSPSAGRRAMQRRSIRAGDQTVGGGGPLFVIAGPCVIEDLDTCLRTGERARAACAERGLPYIFKASFDKANRTSRGSFRGPGMANVDFTVIKNNALRESVNLQLRFEFFNILNRVNLRNVNGNLASSTFGRSTSTFNPRIIQLGARITF